MRTPAWSRYGAHEETQARIVFLGENTGVVVKENGPAKLPPRGVNSESHSVRSGAWNSSPRRPSYLRWGVDGSGLQLGSFPDPSFSKR